MSTIESHDLPIEKFPIRIEAFHPENRRVVWTHEVREPWQSIRIPPIAKIVGHPVSIRMSYGDGEVNEISPNGEPVLVRGPRPIPKV